MEERYTLYPEITEEAFLEICKAFEDEFPHFEKHELLYDFLDGEYFQTYTHEDKKITFEILRMWDENDIEVRANFDIVQFVSKVRGTILKKVKIDTLIHKNFPRRIHGCCFIVNNTNDEKLISLLADSLLIHGCTVFSFYGKYRELWHNVFDEVFVLKHYTEKEDKVALTVTSDSLEDLADEITLNLPKLKSFNHHCRVIYYDDEEELNALQKHLIKTAKDME